MQGRDVLRPTTDILRLRDAETGFLVAGGAGFVAAGLIYLGMPQARGPSSALRISPGLGPGHAIIEISGAF